MLKKPEGKIFIFYDCIVGDEYCGSYSSFNETEYDNAKRQQLDYIKNAVLENKEISGLSTIEEIDFYKKFLIEEISYFEELSTLKIKWLEYWFEIAKIELINI